MSEKKFVSGFYVNAPRDKAPDFVKAGVGIKPSDFIEWLKQQETNNGFVNFDIKESKDGRWYAEVNTWKPNQKPQAPEAASAAAEDFDDDIPF